MLKARLQSQRTILSVTAFAIIGTIILLNAHAATPLNSLEPEDATTQNTTVVADTTASNGKYLKFGTATTSFGYAQDLAMIKAQTIRNKTEDASPFKDTPQASLDVSDASPLLGPRSAYLNNPNGNPESGFPDQGGGIFRTGCEFSHFAYDDPLVYPSQPGKAHLHMFWGNTDVNAFSSYDTLINHGASTCNGQELNRTGYWAPAVIDGNGNVRIPERIVMYYKAYGISKGKIQYYKPGMENIASKPVPATQYPSFDGGEQGTAEVDFKCSNNFSAYQFADGKVSIPNCSGDYWQNTYGAPYPETRTVMEMDVKFWSCFNKSSATTDYLGWQPSGKTRGEWFYSNCDGSGGQDPGAGAPPLNDKDFYPNLEYFIDYVVMPGEDTSSWFLSSDVSPSSVNTGNPIFSGARGSTTHADWWGGWDPRINKEWVDNCSNYPIPNNQYAGCGFGYLSDGGPDDKNPYPGRALKYRPQYDTQGNPSSYKFPLSTLYSQICQPLGPSHAYTVPMSGAYCKP